MQASSSFEIWTSARCVVAQSGERVKNDLVTVMQLLEQGVEAQAVVVVNWVLEEAAKGGLVELGVVEMVAERRVVGVRLSHLQ